MRHGMIICLLISMWSFAAMDLAGCSSTRTGNPRTPAPTAIHMQFSPIATAAVSSMTLCLKSARFVPSDPAAKVVELDIGTRSVSLASVATDIASVTVPYQNYQGIELEASTDCGTRKSIQMTNSNGNFSTAVAVTARFSGSFSVTGTSASVNLAMQPIVDHLASVTSDSQVKTVLDTTDGQINVINGPAFRQLQETSVINTGVSVSIPNFNQDVGNGNLLVCVIYYDSTTRVLSGLSDTGSNWYGRFALTGGVGGQLNNRTLEVWYAWDITGGSGFHVTADFSGPFTGEKTLSCHEYSGIDTVNPMEIHANGLTGFGADPMTADVWGSKTNELLFGVAVFDTSGSSGPGFTQRSSLGNLVTEDRNVNGLQTQQGAFTSAPTYWIAQAMLFKGK